MVQHNSAVAYCPDIQKEADELLARVPLNHLLLVLDLTPNMSVVPDHMDRLLPILNFL